MWNETYTTKAIETEKRSTNALFLSSGKLLRHQAFEGSPFGRLTLESSGGEAVRLERIVSHARQALQKTISETLLKVVAAREARQWRDHDRFLELKPSHGIGRLEALRMSS
ncbi:hypothetical protein [Rhodanobacter sp. L36]|uniref:hypothetical protein n=1 Tax=Rhodanobacter sp. L36 TaxID=1747221 RepID=UPI00131C7C5D|nr:hypothetical protein [Rhodanobacter sp. L36]